jgi:RNA polymerase sigma factor (sigma-70 family)
MDEDSRNILWVKFKDGDSDAISALYREFAHELYSYGLNVVKDEHLVKDCIQEVFIHLIDKRKTLIVTPKIHLYLFKSLRNKILEELRSKNRKQDIINLLVCKDDRYEPNAEQLMIISEKEKSIGNRIDIILAKLPNRQKEIVYLKYTQGLDYDEIAELLQIDKASARTLLYRSLKTIKDQLSKKIFLLTVLLTTMAAGGKQYPFPKCSKIQNQLTISLLKKN